MSAELRDPAAAEPPPPYLANGGLARYFVEHREVGWMALFAVLIWGALSYLSLPQQEDPSLPRRIARVITILPGATASTVEQLVTNPLEKKIAELETMEEMSSESHAGLSVITLGQRPDFSATVEQEWDKLRAKLSELSMPEGCTRPELRTDFGDVVTMLLAVTGDQEPSYRSLNAAATKLEDELKRVSTVGRSYKIGAVREVVRLTGFPEDVHCAGQSIYRTYEAIRARNQLIAGGDSLERDERRPVRVSGAFAGEDDIRGCTVGTKRDGSPILVGDAFTVERSLEDPLPTQVDLLLRQDVGKLDRQRSVLVAVEMKSGQVIGDFARDVDDAVLRTTTQLERGLRVIAISDQPKSVAHRIRHFTECFAEAVLVVIAVALLLMDWRAAVIVALAIPLTVAITVGGMHLGGIPLHQISIAALIISLGMLVDDPVVAADGINRELAAGRPRGVAAWLGPFKLRRPILFATVINIFAFLPLVLLPGDKKAFIYALPLVVTISLIASRIVSMTFIPLLGYYVLKGQRGFDQGGQARRLFPFGWLDRLLIAVLPAYRFVLEGALRLPWLAVFVAYALLAASFTLALRLGHQFFPPAERNQLLIDVALPESAAISGTVKICADISQLLGQHPEVESAAVFLGGSAPRFYYNVTPKAPGQHLAQFLINTTTAEQVPALVAALRNELDAKISAARCVVKQLEQGPPVDTPIQIRLSGESLDRLRLLANEVGAVLKESGGYKVHDDLGERIPVIDIAVDHNKAGALGILPSQVALSIRAATADVNITELREGDQLVPVVMRLPAASADPEVMRELRVESTTGQFIPWKDFATVSAPSDYATISHFKRTRTVTVKSYAPVDRLAADVLSEARGQIDAIDLPVGYRLEYAGEAQELKQSQQEMGGVMAISLALIMLTMVIQFNSVVKSVAVMLTVPLGLVGGFAGLALFHAPLGFMAMLAIVSLAGVIVSHIIVLSDFIEEARAEGTELRTALIQAGLVRMRPVLVTVLATAGGLIPLTLTGGQLWRPLTAVHIFGLLVATVITLFLLPVFYYLFAARLRWIR